MITAERLRQVVQYDPETGVFIRLEKHPNAPAGSVAGYSAPVQNSQLRYWCIKIDNKKYSAHRLAWLYIHGNFPSRHIDHIDGNGTNNAIANLREATRSENMQNRRLHSNNTSGMRGVMWHKATGKWLAKIQANGKPKHLGLFDSQGAAHEAYVNAAKELHGVFARAA